MRGTKRFKCIKSFVVDKCDDEGFVIENESFEIAEGTIFERNQYAYMSDVRLENEVDRYWIEIPQEAVKEYFEEC